MFDYSTAINYNPLAYNLTNNYASSVMTDDMLYSAGYNSTTPMGTSYNLGTTGTTGTTGFQPLDPDYYYKYMDKNQDYMINYGINQQVKMRSGEVRANSPMEAVNLAARNLHLKIMENEQEQIQNAYEKYCEQVGALYGCDLDKEALRARADLLYQNMVGKTIGDDIKEHGRGQFSQSFIQSLTFGLADRKSAAENACYVNGTEEGRGERFEKIAGKVAGGAVVGGAATVGTWGLMKILSPKMLKNKSLIGILVGIAAGVLAAMRSDHAI